MDKDLDKMTFKELRAYARERYSSITRLPTKAAMLAAIKRQQEKGKRASRVVVNELDHTVSIVVICNHRGVTVSASSPASEVEHTWTLLEAVAIRDMLIDVTQTDTGSEV